VGKLIIALEHPEKETPIRAAWLLGQLKGSRAVSSLIDLVEKTDDVYIARAAFQAPGEIGAPETRQFLGTTIRVNGGELKRRARRPAPPKCNLMRLKNKKNQQTMCDPLSRSPSITPRWSEMKCSAYYPADPRPPIL
jgi:hypothetical protein